MIRRCRLPSAQSTTAYSPRPSWPPMSGTAHHAREAAGLSQRELARRMGTSQAAIDRLESGGVGATLTTLQRVATALGLERRPVQKIPDVPGRTSIFRRQGVSVVARHMDRRLTQPGLLLTLRDNGVERCRLEVPQRVQTEVGRELRSDTCLVEGPAESIGVRRDLTVWVCRKGEAVFRHCNLCQCGQGFLFDLQDSESVDGARGPPPGGCWLGSWAT